jgi:hypothetical protein
MIDINEITPFMKKGWVAMDENEEWWWYEKKPEMYDDMRWWTIDEGQHDAISDVFDIKPVEDWTESLMEIK